MHRLSLACVFVFLVAFLIVPKLSSHVFLLLALALPFSVPVSLSLFLSLRLSPSPSPSNCLYLLWFLSGSFCLGLAIRSGAQAIRLRVHPLYLMIPATVGCSYAFMLPVSTPPNSIAFASGHLLVKDMVSLGVC